VDVSVVRGWEAMQRCIPAVVAWEVMLRSCSAPPPATRLVRASWTAARKDNGQSS
jgi:cytochrome c-type biogenesis protein CcmH/NrfG